MWRRYYAGLILGTAASGVIWLSKSNLVVSKKLWWALVAVLVVKLGAGLLAFRSPGWRSFGAGIVMSIALGFLIFFFGLCTSI